MPFPFPFTMFGANRSSNTPSTPSCDFTYCYGGDWVQGKVGNYGINLTGSGDSTQDEGYVAINNAAGDIVDLTNNFTVASWVKSTSGGGTNKWVPVFSTLSEDNSGMAGGSGYALMRLGTTYNPGGGVTAWTPDVSIKNRYALVLGHNSTTYTTVAANQIDDENWHHVVGVRDDGTSTLWIDGVAQSGTTTTAPVDPDQSSGQAVLGRWGSYSGHMGVIEANGFYASGSIDEVAVWDAPLTPSQISLLSTGSARADSFTPPLASAGAAWATGKVDTYSLDFDGSNDYVALPLGATSGSSDGQSGSIAAWIYADAFGGASGYPTIFAAGNSGDTNWLKFGISTNPSCDGNLAFWNKQSSGGPWGPNLYADSGGTNDDGVIVVGEWTHVVVTCDGSTKNLYLNGTSSTFAAGKCSAGVPTGFWFADVGFTSNYFVQLGGIKKSGANSDNSFNGKMDEVGIWSEVLNLGGVQALYNDGVGAKANTVSSSYLVSYYDMEDGGGKTLTDQTANGYDGTLEGFDDTGTTGSLLLYYDFEIGDNNPVSGNFPASTTVYDVVTASFHPPTAHTGTMTNMTVADFGDWDQGKLGKYSLDFDGALDANTTTSPGGTYVDVAANSLFNFGTNNAFSWATWVKADASISNDRAAIITNTYDGQLNPDGWQVISYNKVLYFELLRSTPAYYYDVNSNAVAPFASSNWVHIAGTYDASNTDAGMTIYVDGVDQSNSRTSNGDWSAHQPDYTDVNFRIAAKSHGSTTVNWRKWNGLIDEVSIWSGSLNQANITSLAAGEKANAISTGDDGCWATGKVDTYSLDFTGSTNYVDLPLGAASGSSNGQSGSIAAWIYADEIVDGKRYPIIFGASKGSGQTDFMRFNISTNVSCLGNLAFGSKIGAVWGPNVYATSGGTNDDGKVVVGEWTHVVVTCDGTTKSMYLNGTSSTFETSNCSASPPDGTWFADMPTVDRNVRMGWLKSGDTYVDKPFLGKMDEVAVWSEVLNLGGVQALYNDGVGAKSNTVSSSYLVSYYDMEDGIGTTLTDQTANGYNGTLTYMDPGELGATLTAYYDMECDGPGSENLKDLSGNSLDGTLTNMSSGTCGSG